MSARSSNLPRHVPRQDLTRKARRASLGGRAPRKHRADSRSTVAAAQLHVPVHRRESYPTAPLADPRAEVARIHSAAERHLVIAVKATVDRGELDVGVEIAAELGDDRAVDGG